MRSACLALLALVLAALLLAGVPGLALAAEEGGG